MRFAPLFALAVMSGVAHAKDSTATATAASAPVSVNVSYSLNIPLETKTEAEERELERKYLRDMYKRSAKECEDLMATIAASCQLTNISVTSQVNRYPGQAPTIYVNANVTMQIAIKG